MNLGNPFVLVTLGFWVVLERLLVVRDARRGKGGTAQDRGTRILIAVVVTVAFWLAIVVALAVRHDSAWWLPGGRGEGPLVAGLVVMWAGLGLRIWSIATLGAEFRTTVEVDAGQRLVESGPYRRLRHPSYTGALLITTGYGIVTGVWPALAIVALLSAAVFARRIQVEEQALIDTMGDTYRDYQRRTSRLLPGIW